MDQTEEGAEGRRRKRAALVLLFLGLGAVGALASPDMRAALVAMTRGPALAGATPDGAGRDAAAQGTADRDAAAVPGAGAARAPDGAVAGAAPVAAPGAPAVEASLADAAPAPAAPSFDLVRLGADGAGLVAGTGAPDTELLVTLDGAEVGRVTTDASGQFAGFLELDPSDAPRALALRDPHGLTSGAAVILAPATAPALDADALTAGLLALGAEGAGAAASPGAVGADGVAGEVEAAARGGASTGGVSGASGAADPAALADAGAGDGPAARTAPGAATARADLAGPETAAIGQGDAADAGADRAGLLDAGAGGVGGASAPVPRPSSPGEGVAMAGAPAEGSRDDGATVEDGAAASGLTALAGAGDGAQVGEAVAMEAGAGASDAASLLAGDGGAADGAPLVTQDAASGGLTVEAGAGASDAVPLVAGGGGAPDGAPLASTTATGSGVEVASGDPIRPASSAGMAGASPALGDLFAAPASVAPGGATPEGAARRGPTVLAAARDGMRVMTPPAPSQGAVAAAVSVDAITYQAGGEVSLSGRAPEGGFVRIYLDGRSIATAPAEDGAWSSPLPRIDRGVYTLRVDELAADGTVASRIETPFLREAPATVAAVMAAADALPEGEGVTVRTVQPGSTLWAIAADRYGAGTMFVHVFEANRDLIADPDLIYPGQVFRLPD
ncbi:MAG: hypothetical protein ACU0BF_06755 [Paracoccaceae bacterium]